MTPRDWLERYQRRGKHDRESMPASPVLVYHETEPWTCATDGKALIAVQGRHVDPVCGDSKWPDRFGLFLDLPPGDQEIDLCALKAWCGPPRWRQLCPDCDGYPVDCRTCEGEMVWEPDLDPALFLGQPFDRRLLARALEFLDGDSVRAGIASPPAAREEKDRLLTLTSPAWRVFLMMLDPAQIEDREALPVFEPASTLTGGIYS